MSVISGLIDYIGGILTSLGVNSTFFIQLAIFCFTYIAMYFIAIKPYMAAIKERKRRTEGSSDKAKDLTSEAETIRETFAREAKEHNSNVQAIYSKSNSEALDAKAKIIEEAKVKVERQTSQQAKDLEDAIAQSRKQLESEIPNISKSIEDKFLRI